MGSLSVSVLYGMVTTRQGSARGSEPTRPTVYTVATTDPPTNFSTLYKHSFVSRHKAGNYYSDTKIIVRDRY
jgi:hypothetical protein